MNIWPRDELRFWAPTQGGVVFIAGAPTFSPPPDPDRRTLIFSADGNNICTVLPFSLFGTTFGGIVLTTSSPVIVLTYAEHGPIVTDAWIKTGPLGSSVYWLGSSMPHDPRDKGFPQAYLNPSPIPERGAPAPPRQRRASPRSVAHRSGLYARFARSNPDIWE